MKRRDYYNSMFKKGVGEHWESAPGKKVVISAFKKFLAPIDGSLVVDVGCGTGPLFADEMSVLNRKNEIKYLGIDFSTEGIAIAKQKYSHAEFKVSDGARTGLKDASVDMVLSYGAYEHFDEPREAIQELSRILKKSGMFFVMIPALGHYRKDRSDEGWYEDKTGQSQWNFFRER